MAPTPPTVRKGMITTQADTTNIMLDVSDVIDQLSPDETPFISSVGKDSLKFPCDQLKHEWLEDQLRPRSGTLAAAYVAGSGTMQVASQQGRYLVPGDTLMVGDVVFRVLAGAPDADVLQVSVIGGTDANQANGATWEKLGHAAQEGGVARSDAAKTIVGKPYNYTQIFKDWTQITGTMDVIKRYGYVSEWSYQVEKILRQLAIDFEKACLYGARSSNEGQDSTPRVSTMGGLFEYIYLQGITNSWNNVMDANGGLFTETLLNDLLQNMWEAGGYPDTIMVNGFNKRQINRWGSPSIRTDRTEGTAGNVIGYYESDYGTLTIKKNRWLRKSDVLVLTMSEIGVGPLNGRQFSSRELPRMGDFRWYEILGEYTMEVHKPSVCHGWIYDTATSA